MITDVMGDLRKRILQTFPERQIYLRSGGEVTYHTLTTRVQVTIVTLIAVLLLWSIVALINVFFGNTLFSDPDARLVEMESRYERQLADTNAKIETAELLMAEQRLSFETMAASIEAKHDTIARIADADTLDVLGEEPLLVFAEAKILMAPTRRDAVDRVARRASVASHDITTGLPLDRSLSSLDQAQNTVLIDAETDLLETIEFKRAVIEATGVDLEEVLDNSARGQGGPFIPLDGPVALLVEGEFQPRTTSIEARLYEAEALTEVVASMPLGQPVAEGARLTSRYGVRRDPFTRRPTHHSGIDFASRSMEPILATAPGTVKAARWSGAYGNMVTIDHGNGFLTRYAHLKKMKVSRGDTVTRGQEIGGMGSTGRSTATHLHYEIHFDGRARDPKTYLKAGRYVQ